MSMQQRGERHLKRMAGVSKRGVDQIEKLDKVARRTFRLGRQSTTRRLNVERSEH